MHFIQLLAVNFQSDVLVKMLKSVIDNASGRPFDSYHNFLFSKVFECFVMINPLSQYDCHEGSIFGHMSLFDQEIDHSCSTETVAKTIQNVKLFSLSSCRTYLSSFFNLLIFLGWSDIVDTDPHCLRHFSDTLIWVLFNKYFQMPVVNCR